MIVKDLLTREFVEEELGFDFDYYLLLIAQSNLITLGVYSKESNFSAEEMREIERRLMEKYRQVLEEAACIPPSDTGKVLLGIWRPYDEDMDWIDSVIISRERCLREFKPDSRWDSLSLKDIQNLSKESCDDLIVQGLKKCEYFVENRCFCSWEEIFGLEIDERNMMGHSAIYLAAEALWLMTLYGFEKDSCSKGMEKLKKELMQIENDRLSGEGRSYTLEELEDALGIKKEELTEEEILMFRRDTVRNLYAQYETIRWFVKQQRRQV